MKIPKVSFDISFICISFLSYVFSNGQNCIPILCWIYPVFFLSIFRIYRTGKSVLIVLAIYIIGFIIQWMQVIGMGIGVCIGLGVLFSLIRIIPYLLHRLIRQKNQCFVGTLVFPMAVVVIEYIIYLVNPILAGLSDSYTQYENLTLISITTIFGVYGISFIMAWTASVIDWIIEKQGNLEQIKKGGVIFFAVICTVFFYGNIDVYLQHSSSRTVRIASVTVPVKEVLERDPDVSKVFYSDKFNEQNLKATRQKLLGIQNKLFEKTINEAQAGAKVVFWSELNGAVMKEDEATLISKASSVAKEHNIYLIISLLVKTPYKEYKENKAITIDPKGSIISEYYKSGLSIGELCIKGDGIMKAFDTEYGRIATFICSDMAFTDMIRQAGSHKVDIILIPASDWKEMSPIAIKTATIRGVENGCSVIRQTNMGISIAADYHGNILSWNNYYTSESLSMVTNVPLKGRFTIYTIWGNMLAWICSSILLLIILLQIWPKFKNIIKNLILIMNERKNS